MKLRPKNIATVTVQVTGVDEEGMEIVAVKAKTTCQCEACGYRNALLFMGVVMHIIEESGLNAHEIMSQAQMVYSTSEGATVH
jgi:hypothetical protein